MTAGSRRVAYEKITNDHKTHKTHIWQRNYLVTEPERVLKGIRAEKSSDEPRVE